MSRCWTLMGVPVILALSGAPARGTGAARTEGIQLTRLLPPTVVLCLEGRDIAGLWGRVRQGEFARRLRRTNLWRSFVSSPAYAKMANARTALMERHQLDVEGALLEVFGRDVVMAWALERGGAGGGRKPYPYLLAARAVSAERLRGLVDKLRAIRTETGELKRTIEHRYRNRIIYEEVCLRSGAGGSAEERTVYYCVAGNLLLLGERIGPVKAAVDRLAEPGKPSLADSPRWRQAMAGLPTGCRLRAFVDVAALSPLLGVLPRGGGAGRRFFLERFRQAVRLTDTLAVGLRLVEGGVQVVGDARVRGDRMEASTAARLRTPPTPHALWRLLPASTVVAWTWRVDLPALVERLEGGVLAPVAAERMRRVMVGLSAAFGGLDFRREVLPLLGPEAGLVVSKLPSSGTRTRRSGSHYPRGLAATFLIQVSSTRGVDSRMLTALGALAWAGVTGNNQNPSKPKLLLKVERVGDVSLTYIDFVGPHPLKGTLSPCFAKVGGFVAVSTSREALREFIATLSRGRGLLEGGVFRRHLNLTGGAGDGFIYINPANLVAVVRANIPAILANRRPGRSEGEVRADLENLLELLGLVDGISLCRTHSPQAVRVYLTVTGARGRSN